MTLSKEIDKMVHLLTTREGNLCGEPGEANADINLVTCPECRRHYETEEQRLENLENLEEH
jgi:hypothetical protein